MYQKHSDDRTYTQHEHVRVAEKKLGRKLGKKEVVHHADENKLNNDPENIVVFRTTGDHNRHHSKLAVELFQTSDGSYVAVKQQRECPCCNRLFEPDNNRDVYCSLICHAKNKAKGIPSVEELKVLIWTKPATQIAETFGVSDVAVRKWCDKYGIEKPGRGHWVKVKHGVA